MTARNPDPKPMRRKEGEEGEEVRTKRVLCLSTTREDGQRICGSIPRIQYLARGYQLGSEGTDTSLTQTAIQMGENNESVYAIQALVSM